MARALHAGDPCPCQLASEVRRLEQGGHPPPPPRGGGFEPLRVKILPRFPQMHCAGLGSRSKWSGPEPSPLPTCGQADVHLWSGPAAVVTLAPAGHGPFPQLGPSPSSSATFALKGPVVGSQCVSVV